MAAHHLEGPVGDPWGLDNLDPPERGSEDGSSSSPSMSRADDAEDFGGGNDADMGTMSEAGIGGGIDAEEVDTDDAALGLDSEQEQEEQRQRDTDEWVPPERTSPVHALRRQAAGSDSGASSNTATVGTTAGAFQLTSPGTNISSSSTAMPGGSSTAVPGGFTSSTSQSPLSSPPIPLPLYPRLTRAFSMPLPAQLRHLQHPLVRSASSNTASSSVGPATEPPGSPTAGSSSSSDSLITPAAAQAMAAEYFHSLSLELADSVQPIVQTLLQLSPPHILDPAKEQFSASMVQIPTASVSGLLNAMKGLNFLSARLAAIGDELAEDLVGVKGDGESMQDGVEDEEEFDIGEMLQSVGDTLSGLAAQAGVDLVLFHGEVGMLHVSVKGDESAVSFVLTHVLRQVLSTAERGDTLELGLHIARSAEPRSPVSASYVHSVDYADPHHPLPHSHTRNPSPVSPSPYHNPFSPPRSTQTDPPPNDPSLLYITFTIQHRLLVPILPYTVPVPFSSPTAGVATHTPFPDRLTPNFNGSISSRLLASLQATFSSIPSSTTDPDPSPTRSYALNLPLKRGAPLVEPPPLTAADALSRQPYPSYSLPREPTLIELAQFARVELRNKRVALYASPSSAFARVVTSYVTSWGMDVVHVPTDGAEERDLGLFGQETLPEDEQAWSSGQEGSGTLSGLRSGEVTSSEEPSKPPSHSRTSSNSSIDTLYNNAAPPPPPPEPRLSFVIIDDDVLVLRRRLVQLRNDRNTRDADSPMVLSSDAASSVATRRQRASSSTASGGGGIGQKLFGAAEQRRPSLHHRPHSNQAPRGSPAPGLVEVGSPPKSSPPTATMAGSSSGNDSGQQSGTGSSNSGDTLRSGSPIIIHFTSLANFKLVRDAVQTILTLPPPHMLAQNYFSPYVHPSLPNVLVVPKPAGPRRLLTALHTGLSKPLVDPFFAPIATSPLSPTTGTHPLSPFFSPLGTAVDMLSSAPTSAVSAGPGPPVFGAVTAPSPSTSPAPNPAVASFLSNMSLAGGLPPAGTLILPSGATKQRSPGPSPLAQPPQTVPESEYFPPSEPAAAGLTIGSSPSSGVILQSPDGRPHGVFFQPQSRTASNSGTGIRPGQNIVPSSSASSVQQPSHPQMPAMSHSHSGSSVGSSVRHMSKDDFPRPTYPLQSQTNSPPSFRALPSGTIFSPSGPVPFVSSYDAHQDAAAPKGLRRVHTAAEARPFLLPFQQGRDEAESGDNAGEGRMDRSRVTRRTPSSGTTGSAPSAIGAPQQAQSQLPHVSRPGSVAQQATIISARPGSRRTSGQIVHEENMSFGQERVAQGGGSGSTGSDDTAGQPSSEEKKEHMDAQKEAARNNIRKLILAGDVSSPSTPAGTAAAAAIPAPASPPTAQLVAVTSPAIPVPPPSTSTPTKTVPPVARRTSTGAAAKKKAGDSVIVPPINVLIVEDNPINQTILTTFMRRKKIKFGTAKDGAEAVEKWKTGGYHLILMDIQMPVMDGIEATKEIRRLESQANLSLYPTTPPSDLLRVTSPLAKPPHTPGSLPQSSPHRSSVIIVALTASSLQSDRVNALAAGCNDFLTKPVSLTWLEKKIIEWGSIKALQMWADSAVTRTFTSGQAARGQKVRESLRIDRSGRNSPGPTTPAGERPRSIPGPAPVVNARHAVSGLPLATEPSRGTTIDERRAASATSVETDESYFPSTMTADVVGPAEAKRILLQDVLEESESDSPAETIKPMSPPEHSDSY